MKRKTLTLIVIGCTLLLTILITINKGDLSYITNVKDLGKALGFLTLIPTLLAVLLAFITNNVVFSLLIGFLSGVLLVTLSSCIDLINIPLTFISETYRSLKTVVTSQENLKIIILCFVVGGMVEVVKSSGGFEALAIKLTKRVNTPRKANLIGSLLGCLIFFDDYANALIVGPIMKPITDRVKISREKLSYIVDSTAAPVTGISIISSWVAVEVSAIEQGLTMVGINENGFTYFLRSVPFCFYCIFALTFIFLNAITGREYGPMLKAETRARNGEPISQISKKIEGKKYRDITDKFSQRIFTAISSILLLVLIAVLGFYFEGKRKALLIGSLQSNAAVTLDNVIKCISLADTMKWIIISALVAAIVSIIFGCLFKLFTFNEAIKSWLLGAKKLISTIILLILAWCLADCVSRIGTTYYVVELISNNVTWYLVPLLIFICCCVVSFASGSYGCLFVVMPLAIPLAYRIISMGVVKNDEIYLLTCIGSVMAGSIFGDHCSPITDCTILSALGCGCDTMEHVHTQMPYALTVGAISILSIVLTSLNINLIIVFILAISLELLILFIIGKKPAIRKD